MKLVAAFACLVVQVGVVRADGRGAEAAVRALIDGRQPDDPTQRDGVKVLGPDGLELSRFTGALIALPGPTGADGAPDLRTIAAIDWKLGVLTISTDDARGVAWFQAPAALDIQFPIGGANCCRVTSTTLRASGIVVRDPKGTWHVVTLALSRQLADVALFRGATEPVPDRDARVVDDDALAKAAATWFPAKGDTFIARNAAGPTIVASGTSPTEYATGPAGGALAAAWDKLGLRVKTIEATTYGKDHAIGLVVVTVGLPYKQKAAPMTLYAIATRDDKGAWRWGSLQWTTALAQPPVAGPESRETTNEPTRKR